MTDLPNLRAEIDRVDDALAALLAKRFAVVDQIKAVKNSAGQMTYQPVREMQILRRLQALQPELSADMLRAVWRGILNEGSARQGQLKIGVTDALTDAKAHFGYAAELQTFETGSALFDALENKAIDLAVITLPNNDSNWELFIQFNYVKVIEKIQNHLVLGITPAAPSGNDRTIVATRYKAAVPEGSMQIGAMKRATVFDCRGFIEHEYFLEQAADETLIIGHYPVL